MGFARSTAAQRTKTGMSTVPTTAPSTLMNLMMLSGLRDTQSVTFPSQPIIFSIAGMTERMAAAAKSPIAILNFTRASRDFL